jgi:hypothetical protein
VAGHVTKAVGTHRHHEVGIADVGNELVEEGTALGHVVAQREELFALVHDDQPG